RRAGRHRRRAAAAGLSRRERNSHRMRPMFRVAAATLAIAIAPLATLAAQQPQELLAITRANVVDGVSDTRIRNATIVIRAGKIESIRENGAVPQGARVLDAANRWVAPGM